MSLSDILQIERERVIRERVVLTTVYDRMKNRINNSVRVKAKECIYTIPGFLTGYPLIDIDKTMAYLLSKLKKEGFIALQLTSTDLYVTWDPEKIRQLNHQVKPLEPKKEQPLYSKVDRSKQLWEPRDNGQKQKSVEKKLVEKEFERANEDFISSLIISKKNDKN